MAGHNELGKWGEQLAADKYVADGYHIYARNWRMGKLEIDIIAVKDDVVAFAEVKTRSDLDVDPLEAIDKRKINHMVRSATAFLEVHDLPYNVRFDVFGVNGTPEQYRLEHIEDAFYPPLKTYR
ncbi:MAG: YraN family protein [Muribaculaceae bacterium]|nr:YraN family protein [Muribaculaceae bacterium]